MQPDILVYMAIGKAHKDSLPQCVIGVLIGLGYAWLLTTLCDYPFPEKGFEKRGQKHKAQLPQLKSAHGWKSSLLHAIVLAGGALTWRNRYAKRFACSAHITGSLQINGLESLR